MSVLQGNEHFKEWLDFLDTTDLPQAREYLCGRTMADLDADPDEERPLGYCCLGLIVVMMEGADSPSLDPYDRTLAPMEAIEWLGLQDLYLVTQMASDYEEYNGVSRWEHFKQGGDDGGGLDLTLDIPAEFGKPGSPETLTAASMNDAGFTFAQIADMIRYFGVREVH